MLLAWLVMLPVLTAAAVALVPRPLARLQNVLAVLGSGLTLALAVVVARGFAPVLAIPQYVFIKPWVPAFGAVFSVAVDGISLGPVLVTALLGFVAQVMRGSQPHTSGAALLVCQAAALGVFTAQDMLLVWACWCFYLAGLVFTVGLRGGRSVRACTKLALCGFSSLALMFGVFVFVALQVQALTGRLTFAYAIWERLVLPLNQQLWCFGLLLLALVLILPLVPFEAWWKAAYGETPPVGAVALSLGPAVYSLLRFALPMFPLAAHHLLPWLQLLALLGVVLAAVATPLEIEFRRKLAWLAWAQSCLCVVGIASLTAQGFAGALMLWSVSGLAVAGLLLCLDPAALSAGVASAHVTQHRFVPSVFALTLAAMPGLGGFSAAFVLFSGIAAAVRLQDQGGLPLSDWVLGPLWLVLIAMAAAVAVGVAVLRSVRAPDGPVFLRLRWRAWPVFALMAALLLLGIWPKLWFARAEATINASLIKYQRRVRHSVLSPEAPAHFYPNERTPLSFQSEAGFEPLAWDVQ